MPSCKWDPSNVKDVVIGKSQRHSSFIFIGNKRIMGSEC